MNVLRAYVLVNVSVKDLVSVVLDLEKLFGVNRVDLLYGVYDLIVIGNLDTLEECRGLALKVQRVANVRSALLLAVRGPSGESEE